MVIFKRAGRMLRRNFFKYLCVMLIVILGMAVVIGYGNTSFSARETVDRYWEETNVEDGEFTTYVKLTDKDKSDISDMSISLQETFYFDIDAGNGFTYRLFHCRKEINKEHIVEGKTDLPADDEIRLERIFMEDNGVNLGDKLTIDGEEFTIVSKVVVPDYAHRVAEISNVGTNEKFALIFVNDSTYERLLSAHGSDEVFNYTYTVDEGDVRDMSDNLYNFLKELPVAEENITDKYVLGKIAEINDKKRKMSDGFDKLHNGAEDISDGVSAVNTAMGGAVKELGALSEGAEKLAGGIDEMRDSVTEMADELLTYDYPNLYRFNIARDNTRVVDFVDAHEMYFSMALVLGLLIAVLIAYIISVFSANIIDSDSKTIGTLYAMGYRRSELLRLYLLVPGIAVCIGAVIGTLLGFAMTDSLIAANYSHPEMIHTYPPVLLVYGIAMPIVVTLGINYFMVNKKLGHTALEILQNRRESKVKAEDNIPKREKGFIKAFRNSQTRKELKSHAVLFFGMALAILIMMLGMAFYGSMTKYAESITDDTRFEYMYVLSNPIDNVPDGAEKSFTVSLSMYCDMAGTELPVVIQGVEKDSRFFDFSADMSDKKNLIYASDSAIIKYGCRAGDKLIFTDSLNKKDYALTVAGEVSYKNGIFFFMDIDSMREYFGVPDDYYNTLLSDAELDIDRDMLISRTTKKSIVDTAESWVHDTKGTIGMFLVMSVVIFVLVTCILVKNMLERSVYQISLLKLIGYRTGELNRVYLNNTALTMLLAVIFAFPAGTRLMDYLIPVMNGSMKSGMANHIMPSSYIIMTGMIAVSYLAAYLMMQRRLAKIEANEVLKDRE